MTSTQVVEAVVEDIPSLVHLLGEMQKELQEFAFDADIVKEALTRALADNVHWFVFRDEQGAPFGACYLQSVHNYWRAGLRFYLGGFYIAPTHRKQGRFKEIYGKLKLWAEAHGGVQIYAHIHMDNAKSLETFGAVGMHETEYRLCAHHWG